MKEEINYPMELIMSDKLRKSLEDSDSKIAKKLLELTSLKGVPEWINYLDVAKDDATKISYLNKQRYGVVAKNPAKDIMELKEGDTFVCIDATINNNSPFGLGHVCGETFVVTSCAMYDTCVATNILEAKLEGSSCYWNFRSCDIDVCQGTSYWDKNTRYMASCGKVIQKLLGPQDGKELAKFCQLFQTHHPDFRFQADYSTSFVKGEDIRKWYLVDNYHSTDGSLGNSCMRYTACQKYFDLYVETDICQMFIVCDKDSGKLVGRCLVWNNEYFDRVYGISTVVEEKMIVYLKSLGLRDVYGDELDVTYKIDKGSDYFEYYPYCDSFHYIGTKSLSTSSDSDWEHNIQTTDGRWNGYEDDEESCCAECGESCSSDDLYYIEGVGDCCSGCRQYSEYDDCDYLSNDVVYSEWRHSYIHDNDAVRTYDGDYTHEDEAVELHDGRYTDNSDDDLAELEEGYALKDECEYSELNAFYILKKKAHYCDNQKDWVYEHQLITKDEEEPIES